MSRLMRKSRQPKAARILVAQLQVAPGFPPGRTSNLTLPADRRFATACHRVATTRSSVRHANLLNLATDKHGFFAAKNRKERIKNYFTISLPGKG
jgi:hypothetical protein